uniref:Phosphatidylserine decarboxylase n=1 Tax=Mycena chlorophos TaxID=658473 RepID=A0ABQ0MCM7_MYCCL|nr:phosphatidylserine decarboxylase [Mycena chlorophos]
MSTRHLTLQDRFRRAGWAPANDDVLRKWIQAAVDEVLTGHRSQEELLPAVAEFQDFIEASSDVYMGFHQMFEQQPEDSVVGAIKDYKTLCKVFNKLIQEAPFYGPIGPPFYMVLSGCMNTQGGFTTFLNEKLNNHFKMMWDVWAEYLNSPASCSVLTNGDGGWFSPPALTALVENFDGLSFEKIFACDPAADHYGYKSWDDFFVRTFKEGIRTVQLPDNPNIINAACESELYHLATNVQERDQFWIKGEPYSLLDMLNQDELASHFVGGTVFQGFLSVTGYHRWHAPVTGTISKIVEVPGTYFAQSPATLGENLIFIQADDARVGLMCFISVGMTEVSTCEATVKEGDHVNRGDELGMFHFGGSTHCLVFREATRLQFFDNANKPGSMIAHTRRAPTKYGCSSRDASCSKNTKNSFLNSWIPNTTAAARLLEAIVAATFDLLPHEMQQLSPEKLAQCMSGTQSLLQTKPPSLVVYLGGPRSNSPSTCTHIEISSAEAAAAMDGEFEGSAEDPLWAPEWDKFPADDAEGPGWPSAWGWHIHSADEFPDFICISGAYVAWLARWSLAERMTQAPLLLLWHLKVTIFHHINAPDKSQDPRNCRPQLRSRQAFGAVIEMFLTKANQVVLFVTDPRQPTGTADFALDKLYASSLFAVQQIPLNLEKLAASGGTRVAIRDVLPGYTRTKAGHCRRQCESAVQVDVVGDLTTLSSPVLPVKTQSRFQVPDLEELAAALATNRKNIEKGNCTAEMLARQGR